MLAVAKRVRIEAAKRRHSCVCELEFSSLRKGESSEAVQAVTSWFERPSAPPRRIRARSAAFHRVVGRWAINANFFGSWVVTATVAIERPVFFIQAASPRWIPGRGAWSRGGRPAARFNRHWDLILLQGVL